MKTLSQIKAETRARIEVQLGKFRPITSGATNDLLDEVDSLIDATFLAIKEGVVPEEEYGKHKFEVGYNRCAYCNEPRVVIDRKKVIIRKNETGGEIAEVTEKRIDTTDFPCPKNPLYGYNRCRAEVLRNFDAMEGNEKSV